MTAALPTFGRLAVNGGIPDFLPSPPIPAGIPLTFPPAATVSGENPSSQNAPWGTVPRCAHCVFPSRLSRAGPAAELTRAQSTPAASGNQAALRCNLCKRLHVNKLLFFMEDSQQPSGCPPVVRQRISRRMALTEARRPQRLEIRIDNPIRILVICTTGEERENAQRIS